MWEELNSLLQSLSSPENPLRPVELEKFKWEIPSPSFTPYKNVYHGGEDNEKREVLYKHIFLTGPSWLGELKLELSWHYWVMRLSNEFIVDHIRATIVDTRPNKTVVQGLGSNLVIPPVVSFEAFAQSWGPLMIPYSRSEEPLQVHLRDITVRPSATSIVTTYTFSLAFEYAKRLKLVKDPDSFEALFGGNFVECLIGSYKKKSVKLLEKLQVIIGEFMKAADDVENTKIDFDNRDGEKYKIICESKLFYVDKQKLARSSPVFAACFEHADLQEEKSQSFPIPNFSSEAVEDFLVYCATGIFAQLESHVIELARLADQYQVSDLLKKCQVVLMRNCILDGNIKVLIESTRLASELTLPWLFLTVHIVVEEGSKYWIKEERDSWFRFITENSTIPVDMLRTVLDFAETSPNNSA